MLDLPEGSVRVLRRWSRGQISPVVTGGDELGRRRDSPAVDSGSKSGEGVAWTGARELRIDPRHGTELQRGFLAAVVQQSGLAVAASGCGAAEQGGRRSRV